jgi:8-oxo-dGTP pyrophosphatase MutT (NUDIX family)
VTDPAAVPAPAATIVLLRPGPDGAEILLTLRPATMAFGAGLHVFPGGRVDPEDAVPTPTERSSGAAIAAARALGDNLPPDEALAVHRAALRELREEAGIVLDGIDRLVPIAHWTTPSFMPRRFSTWFFVADVPPDAVPVFAPDEVADDLWLTPRAALKRRAKEELSMWVPTSAVIQRLVEINATTAADVAGQVRFAATPAPQIAVETPSVVRLRVGSAGALPGRVGIVSVHGHRDVVVVDPGDPSDAALDAIRAVVERRGGTIRAIVLSGPNPDRAAGAEALAHPLGVPILVAPGDDRDLPYATTWVADKEQLPADVALVVKLGGEGIGGLDVVPPESAGK